MKKTSFALTLLFGLAAAGSGHAAPISLSGGSYAENFDTLINTPGSTTSSLLPNGWSLAESGDGARNNGQYGVDSGTGNTGDIYSYGTANATDRALGSLRSGALIPIFGAQFRNDTGSAITALDIAYIGEQWRLGTAGRSDRLAFQYSTDASSLFDGTYLGFDALDFVTPNTVGTGAKNGNQVGNFSAIGATLSGLNIANNASFWIRWVDVDASGADDGLAIDNFALTPGLRQATASVPEPAAPALALIGLASLLTVSRLRRSPDQRLSGTR